MDATEALAELKELSSQIELAIVIDEDWKVLGWTAEDAEAIDSLATTAKELVDAAGEIGASDGDVSRVEVELAEGALFVLREGGNTVAATTGPNPTAGLVAYDLRTCLQRIGEPEGGE